MLEITFDKAEERERTPDHRLCWKNISDVPA